MSRIRIAAWALALGAAAGSAPALAGGGDGRLSFGHVGYTEVYEWRGRHGTRYHRTALDDGFFGHGGRNGAAVPVNGQVLYDYDRGYPYDYYDYGGAGADHEHAEDEWAPAAVSRCDSQLVWDDHAGEEVAVRICRN